MVRTGKVIVEVTDEPLWKRLGATHCLRFNYHNLFGVSKEHIDHGVETLVANAINPVFMEPLGYDWLGYQVFYADNYFEMYYKSRGSPAIPLVPILATICIIIIGIVIVYVAWVYLETKKIEQEEKQDKKELLEKGMITNEQYETMIKEQAKEEDMLGSLKWILILFVIIVIIGAIAPALPKRGEKK